MPEIIASVPFDKRKEHRIVGEGQGKDLYIQDGRFYTSWGTEIEPNEESIRKHGIRVNGDIRRELHLRELNIRQRKSRERWEAEIKRMEEEEKKRILAGEPSIWDEQEKEEDEMAPLDFSGLDDLEEEVAPAPAPKPVNNRKKKA